MDNLVCEVRRLPSRRRFSWYERKLNSITASEACEESRVIGASTARTMHDLSEECSRIPTASISHLQFEATSCARGAQLAEARGWIALPAAHLAAAPPSEAALLALIHELSEVGGPIVKVAYPCDTPEAISIGLNVLQCRDPGMPEVALIPRGSRQARVLFALAGSRLVYAPLRQTSERMSADWFRGLTTRSSTLDPGVQDFLA